MSQRVARDFVIRNDLAELDTLARGLQDLGREAGLGDDLLHDVRLALEEAVSNTIRHGYEGAGAGDEVREIRVRAEVLGGSLVLEVEDDGMPFNPLEAEDPDLTLPLEERPVGGLGIYLLKVLMDDVDYRRIGAKNILRLTKRVGEAGRG